jgi:hypothetical protein
VNPIARGCVPCARLFEKRFFLSAMQGPNGRGCEASRSLRIARPSARTPLTVTADFRLVPARG